ncbi:MAG: heavy metal translocating P-type ATPase metal-binding domain-containing protein [Saprospiraceae bacterium]|nr:heavy metal translocating P-type ATPase metal-binding domain-containing protein [Saprospiraceae bacterium]
MIAERPQADTFTAHAAPSCYHCGEDCPDDHIHIEEKLFCCEGCKMVFEILNDNGMCRYYELDEKAGVSLRGKTRTEYAFLDDPQVKERLIDYTDGAFTRITFYLPSIHCASCIWLLENLHRLVEGVRRATVNFPKKEVFISYDESKTSLRRIVELLAHIGYEPAITLSDLDDDKKPVVNRTFYYKLGVAGFAFGNIMLLSFPEYLGLEKADDGFFFKVFGYLNILLSLPVVLYSGRDYFHSAWTGLRQRQLTIDVPLALGIAVLFLRSVFEIVTHTGAGYMDSLAGLVFFLLIGRWFQQKTYHNISFERDYKSYFPIAAAKKVDGEEVTVSLDQLEAGHTIVIRHKELIPADAVLLHGEARIDYSFVTGESEPVERRSGEKIYAGGRQMAGAIDISLTRKVSQSYLTQLWNDDAFTKKTSSNTSRIANRIGKYFTITILFIGLVTLLYWLPKDMGIAVNAFTAVMIIACPCAVALAVPFIFGNVLRILARRQFYLKNTAVIESLEEADAVVFDKTGTITQRENSEIWFVGEPLSFAEKQWLYALAAPSSHPVSRHILGWLGDEEHIAVQAPQPLQWHEETGKGVEAVFGQRTLRLGSAPFMTAPLPATDEGQAGVFVQINDQIRGWFRINQYFRPGTKEVLSFFAETAPIYLLSGDNDREKALVAPLFGGEEHLHFQQSPQDKLQFVKALQNNHRKVLMLGDGLNDAGALQQSDAGVVLAENTNNFTPACDAILHAASFEQLPALMQFVRRSTRLVYYAYALAFVYNVVGLSYAVQGALSPVVAAILMPTSSVSIVLFGILSSNWLARRVGL